MHILTPHGLHVLLVTRSSDPSLRTLASPFPHPPTNSSQWKRHCALRCHRTELIKLRFYVRPDTKQVISETFFPANLLAKYWKTEQIKQSKHASTGGLVVDVVIMELSVVWCWWTSSCNNKNPLKHKVVGLPLTGCFWADEPRQQWVFPSRLSRAWPGQWWPAHRTLAARETWH